MKQTPIRCMPTFTLLSSAVLPLLVAALSSAQLSAQKIVKLDVPGADTTADSFNGTFASSINNWGAITGYYIDSNNVYHGFLRSPEGRLTSFETPGADTTAGSFNGTAPSGINDLGAVTGEYWDASGTGHGFLRSPEGKYTTWIGPDACTGNGSEGCFGSGASNINAFGTIAGGFEDNSGNFVHHSFVRNARGELKTFDVPGAGTGGYQGTGCPGCALGLNQLGAIAGIYSDANSVNHGYLRSPKGEFTTFDAPEAGTDALEGTGCPSDCPVMLNDWGAIAGIYIDANSVLHGYLRSPDGKFATVDPLGSVFTWPSGLNDFGAITGYYYDANNVAHGFIRVP